LARLSESFDSLAKRADNQEMDTNHDRGVHERRLRTAAAAAGFSFAQLARMMDLSPSGFCAKRRGRRPWFTGEIEQLGLLLSVSSAWLMSDDEKDGAR
jgi:hypothetical protein